MKKCCNDPWSTLSDDPWLDPFRDALAFRRERARRLAIRLAGTDNSLADFASGHEFFGLHRHGDDLVFRERAPHAQEIFLIGPFCDWAPVKPFQLRPTGEGDGVWETRFPASALPHACPYRLLMRWHGGEGDRIPSHARRVVQDPQTGIFNAQAWMPAAPHVWRHAPPTNSRTIPLVYEAHVGMAQETEGVGSYEAFRTLVLPRIAAAGYNTLQLMALMEHPYYASFGYHVSSFFAASSRFGTPDDLKALIDDAHGLGLRVIMDLVHSHAVRNETEGLSRFDGTDHLYFHAGPRGLHAAWDSRCFDYGKIETLHFLLSNCRFWLDEYRVDGFRFDGVTSMLYHDRGLGRAFDRYERYFDDNVDEDALAYLTLANTLIHQVRPDALTIAEDVSGMPGLATPVEQGGAGFDSRMAMGIPDCWFKLIKDTRDEDWDIGWLWHELTNRRPEERTVSYVESHDQALVGGKTAAFELMDAAMYHAMRVSDTDLRVERGMALHKMMRLATLASCSGGYLNFMGNEFGHPEWVDFPREGNGWSYRYARRQWSLRDDPSLKYRFLGDFDQAMLALIRERPAAIVAPPCLLQALNDDKILIFARGNLFFFFNFHPDRSRTEFAIEVPPGVYRLLLDTDEPRFGGPARLAPGQVFRPAPERDGHALRSRIRVYLPCRCALALEREPETARGPAREKT